MLLTLDNYQAWTKHQGLLESLLKDVNDDNERSLYPQKLEIHVQDWHDESEEYPDYYGTFWIQWNEQSESIHSELDLKTLDHVLCAIHYAFENLQNEKQD